MHIDLLRDPNAISLSGPECTESCDHVSQTPRCHTVSRFHQDLATASEITLPMEAVLTTRRRSNDMMRTTSARR